MPWPPPGAGTLAAAWVVAPLAGAGAAVAGLVAAVEFLGLNKSAKVDLAGDGDAAGLAAVAAAACLRARFGLGEAAGEAAVEGDAAVSVAAAVVAAFLRVRCFAGDSAGLGD